MWQLQRFSRGVGYGQRTYYAFTIVNLGKQVCVSYASSLAFPLGTVVKVAKPNLSVLCLQAWTVNHAVDAYPLLQFSCMALLGRLC